MGEEGQGWRIAMQTLQYERGAEAGAAGGISILSIVMDDLLRMAAEIEREGEPLLQDPVTRDNLIKFMIEEKALQLAEKRIEIPALCRDYPNSIALSGKLRSTEFFRRMRQYALTLQGAQGSLYVGDQDTYRRRLLAARLLKQLLHHHRWWHQSGTGQYYWRTCTWSAKD